MGKAPSLASGVWGVLATPFSGPLLAVDHESIADQVAFYRDLPATGVVALGVFGEAEHLTAHERGEVVATVSSAGAGLPIVVGLPSRSTVTAIDDALRAAAAAGDALAAVMVQVNTTDARKLAAHLEGIHQAAQLPIVVQDYPAASGVHIQPEALGSVLSALDFVVAVKSESPPTAVAIASLTARLDIPIFGGLGGVGLLDELRAGAAGAMTGFSYPEGLWAAVRGWREGGFARARDAYRDWLPLANFEAQPGIGLAIRKEILRRRGLLREASVRPPAKEMPAALAPQLEDHLAAVELAVNS